jgi:hypothetical protein
MKKRTRLLLIGVGGLAILAIGILVALGIRNTILRGNRGGSLFSILAGASATPGAAAAEATLPTRPAVSLQEHPCYNLLYPFMPGTVWRYTLTARGTTYSIQMTVPSASGTQAEMDLAVLPGGFTSQSNLECNNGGVHSMPYLNTGMLLEDVLKGSLSLEYVSGDLAPTFDAFETVNWDLAWSGSYLASGTGTLHFQGNDYYLLVNQAPLTIDCRTAGSGLAAFETVTVPAGTYHALKVTCTISTLAVMAFNSWSASGNVTGQFTEWYGPYVGLVKMQPDSINVSSPLVSFPVSVANSGLELAEYHAP